MFRSSYESVPEQLRKCSGALTKVFRNSYKSSVAVISLPDHIEVFRSSYESIRNSYKSSVAVISLPDHL